MSHILSSQAKSAYFLNTAEKIEPSIQTRKGFLPSHLTLSETPQAASAAESLSDHVKLGEEKHLIQKAALLLLLAEKHLSNAP